MSDVIESARLIVAAEAKGFGDTQAQITQTESALNQLTADYKAGTVGPDEYMKSGARLQARLDGLKAAFATADAAVKKHGNSQAALAALTKESGSKLAGFGQAALQSGRIVQDFAQGGVGGILNNIEGFTQALGGGAGLAGILTIVGVGLALLKPQIEEFLASLGEGQVQEFGSALQRAEATIKELSEKPHLIAIDILQLEAAKSVVEEIKANLAAVEKLKRSQAHYEKESGAAIGEAIREAEGGAQGVRQKLIEDEVQHQLAGGNADMAQVMAEIKREKGQLKQALESPEGGAAAGFHREQLRKLEERRDTVAANITGDNGTAAGAVGEDLRLAEEGAGPDQAEHRRRLANRLRHAGRGELAQSVELAAPERLKQDEEEEEESARRMERARAAGAARRDKAAREKKRVAAAEKEGNEARQSPEFKEHEAKLKRSGDVDEFGRRRFTEGFDERSADRVREKARAEGIKKAPKAERGLSPIATPEQIRANRTQEQARYTEGVAQQIYQNSAAQTGVQFTPDQAREAAGHAVSTMQQMGQFGATTIGANQAILSAMQQGVQAMQQVFMRLQQQGAVAGQMGGQFNQVAHQAAEHQPSASNWGSSF
jgi:hypothetical protein